MIIRILNEQVREESQTRYVQIIISDGAFPDATHYALGVGDLPLVGDLQLIFEARFDELWRVAVTKKNSLTVEEVRLKCYNAPLAGGWTNNEFQEAIREDWDGRSEKRDRIIDRGNAIRVEWPI